MFEYAHRLQEPTFPNKRKQNKTEKKFNTVRENNTWSKAIKDYV